MSWPDPVIERMRQLIADGYSASSVQRTLNVEFKADYSRSAVLGKAHRIGLHFGSGGQGAHAEGRVFTPRKPRVPRAQDEPDVPGEESILGIPDRWSGRCKWPYGDPRDVDNFRFCGKQTADEDGPYCARHEGRARASSSRLDWREEAA